MSETMSPKEIHDQLLAEIPEGANHEEAECPFCNVNSVGGGDMSKTYTEDELTAAVNEAVAPVKEAAASELAELKVELDELRAAKAADEIQDEVATIKAQLDQTELRATEAEARVTEILGYFEGLAAEADAAAALEAAKAERLAVISEAASFSDEYVASNIDRWVALSEEDFAALLEDWKAVKSASMASLESADLSEIPQETAMSHTRTEDGPASAPSVWKAARRGTDIRFL